MNKIKKVLLTIGVVAAMTAISSCGLNESETTEPPKYPDYSETLRGAGEEFAIYEVRFTDTEGNKIKCFVMDGYRSGGLDRCEKVG